MPAPARAFTSGVATVVTSVDGEAAETLPVASRAWTLKVYGVFALSPVTVALVAVTVCTVGPPVMRYDTTPRSSLDAAHDSATLVEVVSPATGAPGAVGAVTSGGGGGVSVVNATGALAGETLPAASTAFTVIECALEGVRPDSVVAVAGGLPVKVAIGVVAAPSKSWYPATPVASLAAPQLTVAPVVLTSAALG